VFASVADLARQIRRYIRRYNKAAKSIREVIASGASFVLLQWE
jgi:hypothetical protein